ncbi:NADH-quinone oxidoreductase subunit L [Parapedobacter koreensis]|uniref:NADH dehydrogenase subunit L n=1 Tax=Parapedobacter koreensis TaxID=332977 RepID=A0A1H7J767_9SPHI|nr:NADH-quinone oxidoreductase subunit L [Parapedobacter koreensis]SEK68985.1 NADH dehydrogenase subunit L [Parapedobacter koreensis]
MPAYTLTYPLLAALSAVLLPFAAFLLTAVLGKKAKHGTISIVAISLSLLAAGYAFTQVWGNTPIHIQWHWFTIGRHAFHVGLLLDNMAVLMLVLVCLIALPVHCYSIAYMRGDPGIHRYWAYLSLFCFAMLGLVVADNLLLMYICWELVGFASYLLIGFWYTRDAAVQANKKAFIVNRIGDIGFLLGIAILHSSFGTLDIQALFGPQGLLTAPMGADTPAIAAEGTITSGWLTVAGLAFFLGTMAKSAQFPLHVWLPDAMEGPTSVSSLIHAATMVAAGVFLLARVFPIFDDTTLLVITTTGTVTAFAAAYFALAQYDIKKILAFSTISQLGFMMVGIGIGMYHVALFHLVTHAFFKCLLFLSAGAIIHGMQHAKEKHQLDIDPQDIRHMGGLRRHMPLTFTTMLIASLALAGFPFTAGYLSKDALLVHAFEWAALHGEAAIAIPLVLVIVSILTSFYIFRLLAKVFFARPSVLANNDIHIHEASRWMLAPMAFLAFCSLFPIFTFHPLNDGQVWLLHGLVAEAPTLPPLRPLHILVPALATAATLVMATLAWRWYVNGHYPIRTKGVLYRLSERQGYLNELYDAIIVRPLLKLSLLLLWIDHHVVDGAINGMATAGRSLAGIAAWIDYHLVDGLIRLVGNLAWGAGHVLRRSQTGRVQQYVALVFFIVLVILLYHIFAQA